MDDDSCCQGYCLEQEELMATKTGRISIGRPKPKLLPQGRIWRTASSSRIGVYHYTFELVGMDTWCTCEGFQFNEKCRHIDEIYEH